MNIFIYIYIYLHLFILYRDMQRYPIVGETALHISGCNFGPSVLFVAMSCLPLWTECV